MRKQSMRTFLATCLALVLTALPSVRAWGVVSTGEYYIVNDFWGKLLTANSSNAPRLMAYDSTADDNFVFVAEASGTSGYVKLRHKATGKYLTASTSNAYSVLLSNSGSGDQYLWALDQRFSTTIVSKKNTGKHLGSDFYSGSTYYYDATEVPVYYNKGDGALGWYSVIAATGDGYEASRKVAKSAQYTGEYGVKQVDDYCVSEPVDVSGLDYHIISSTPFEGTGCVNLSGTGSWLVFENVRPSKVASSYLGNVTIDGAAAQNGTNCRVEIWLRGAVVIPLPSVPMVARTDDGTFDIALGNTSDLGTNSNKMRSFTLRRGYMATVATATGGGDYSRVYVADHADLTVTLPTALDQRVSSVYVRNWHYNAKTGYCSTKGDLLNAAVAAGGSWAWNWDAGSSSSADVEYIPIKSHLYWPSDGNFYKAGSTAMMMFNEPEHSEQHTSSKCSCGGTIDAWKAYQQTPKFNATGLRIGSPSATDLSWIKTYVDNCNNMKQRCDFTCTHGYWTSEWTSNLNTLKGYGRPIWITEWEYGASWTSGSNPSNANDARAKVFDILETLEYNQYVERYSYYEFDTGGDNGWMREIFWENTYYKGLAYVGQVYARVKPHFGYDASIQATPNWWTPSASTPAITDVKLSDGKYTLSVTNGNGDATATFQVQRKTAGGTWQTVYSLTDRADFEPTSLKLAVPSGIEAGDVVRVVVTTIYDTATTLTSNEYEIPDYRALTALQNLRFDEGTYVSAGVRTYAKDIKGSETSGLHEVTGWNIPANGDARAAGQYAWGTSYLLGGDGYTAPATGSDGTSKGGALGLVGVWTGTAQYTQNVYLEAGTYTITIPVYNATGGTTAISKNLFGFIADDGTEYLATEKTFTADQWTTLTISFVLNEGTYGRLSVGYVAANKGSGDMPHLFADYVDIVKSPLPDMSALDDLQNLRFNEGTFTTSNITIDNSDKQQEVTGWTIATAGGTYQSGGQLAYGSGLAIGADGSRYAIPSEGTDQDKKGGALALLTAWKSEVQYTQAVTLPAGRYTITVPVYNGGGTNDITKNYFGFIADSGTEYLATTKTFAVGEWTTMSVTFTLMAETPGKLSLGYKPKDASSSGSPHLFADYIAITCGEQTWPSFLSGDIIKDGTLDEKDVQALINHLLGKTITNEKFDEKALDVNGDESVTLADVTALINQMME